MNPHTSLWIAGLLACVTSLAFTWFVRLPLPFEGFAVAAAAGLAGLTTLAVVAWLPASWVWSESERLKHAFQARHGISYNAAGSTLEAIATSHRRANALRLSAASMRDDIAQKVDAMADRLDTAAREIFYEPDRHRSLRAILIRSELIEDAATAHASLRKRNQTETEKVSREKLVTALHALDAAFDQSDLHAARGLLHEVEAASDVAETLLTPRRSS
ncbi:hypothetical protein N9O61_03010 [Octadecabacter sp.]|nr:hypothetical protein [Octadecabacter sp.]